MTSARTLVAVCFLITLLTVQVSVRHRQEQQLLPLVGPVTGEAFPDLQLFPIAGHQGFSDTTNRLSVLLREASPACTLLVVFSSECPICKRMRITWPSQFDLWADSIGAPVQTLWISDELAGPIADFAAPHSFHEALQTRSVILARFPPAPAELLGVYGTPTIYLLDGDGRLALGVMGDLFPPVAASRQICQ